MFRKRSKFLSLSLICAFAAGSFGCAGASDHADGHGHEAPAAKAKSQPRREKPVPAYMTKADAEAANLGPTLAPEEFKGKVAAAYAAVREIPKTIAQLPCYCRCDRSVGHKSLYSCFEDDHGANCTTCTDSALLALKLEKEQNMTPEQIRDTLIKEYSGY